MWDAKRTLKLVAVAAFGIGSLAVVSAQTQQSSPAATLFEKSCYSCHNIGGGDKKGPDLKGVTSRRSRDWLHRYIATPAALNRSGDPDAAAVFKKFAPEVMPDQAISPEQIDAILALIDDLSRKNETFVPAGAKLSRAIVSSDVDGGYRLFTGRTPLSGNGAACISCHSVDGVARLGGGTLGPDLTAVNTKYKDPELIAILQNPNFPTMKSMFGTRPLSDEEIVQLFAYFQNTKLTQPAAQVNPGAVRIEPWFVVAGFVLALLSLGAFSLIWRNRLRGVREPILSAAAASHKRHKR
ncbi:MAG TPA: c-type cytochrome [Blastocatellia bacterium]|nr:c-type cytochrome [Blastocatellia bacterium]